MQMLKKMSVAAVSMLAVAAYAEEAQVEAPAVPEASDVIASMNAAKESAVSLEQAFSFLPEVVAEINGEKITRATIIEYLKKNLPDGVLPQGLPESMLPLLAPQMVNGYIQEQLVQKALEANKITVTAADAAARMKAELDKASPDERKMLEQVLTSRGETVDSLIAQQSNDPRVQQAIAMEMLFDKVAPVPETISEEAMKKFYDENPQFFVRPGDQPGSMRAAHILIAPKSDSPEDKAAAKAEAEALIKQLNDGADFAQLAQEKSTCPSKDQGGALGAFTPGQMVPEFEAAVVTLKEGTISQAPVETKFGFHVIRRDASQGEQVVSFDDAKAQLPTMMKDQLRQQEIQKYFEQLEKDNKVQIFVKAPEFQGFEEETVVEAVPAEAK